MQLCLHVCWNLLIFEEITVNHLKSLIYLTLLHSERPKLYTILAFLSAIGLKGETVNCSPTVGNGSHAMYAVYIPKSVRTTVCLISVFTCQSLG